MSVREEDRQKNTCPSRGLGIAAAAIGVGVGAALYYFFIKRQENPNTAGSTSDWNCERPQTFIMQSDDSYTTISEYETSDTSINDTQEHENWSTENSIVSVESTSEDESTDDTDSSSESDSDSESDSNMISNDVYLSDNTYETGYLSLQNAFSSSMASDSEITEWDVTTSSLGVPEERSRSPLLLMFGRLGSLVSPRRRATEEEQMTVIRQQAFRERSWTLEECSICFDVMLRTQEVTALPCSHNFHTECIMPWLQEKQTCPNCRKAAE